ncbi:hypothetical protein D8674_029085 [Pyrus ussuriensis x Pyrus communis]|uniref:Uncharacterized protein n=1 Tax=Pyrus ussuriensis x Pyrus communis TaxID=2448454 RepID=A0A5N5HZ64_9ROSA|nr:hypothetical protein D8674_029085 [Pyrus ussuriensis x Pyrus communis]
MMMNSGETVKYNSSLDVFGQEISTVGVPSLSTQLPKELALWLVVGLLRWDAARGGHS